MIVKGSCSLLLRSAPISVSTITNAVSSCHSSSAAHLSMITAAGKQFSWVPPLRINYRITASGLFASFSYYLTRMYHSSLRSTFMWRFLNPATSKAHVTRRTQIRKDVKIDARYVTRLTQSTPLKAEDPHVRGGHAAFVGNEPPLRCTDHGV